MWKHLEEHENGGVTIDRANSIYVGDAAGRIATKTRSKDHSAADRLFALNLGVPFQTPEQYFLNKMEEEPYQLPFRAAPVIESSKQLFDPAETRMPFECVELVVLVGSPASGKSFLAEKWAKEHNYCVVSQDELKTFQNCLKVASERLLNGQKVIVDCTNRGCGNKAPKFEEGFREIVRVNFVPNFREEKHKEIYMMHLLEK